MSDYIGELHNLTLSEIETNFDTILEKFIKPPLIRWCHSLNLVGERKSQRQIESYNDFFNDLLLFWQKCLQSDKVAIFNLAKSVLYNGEIYRYLIGEPLESNDWCSWVRGVKNNMVDNYLKSKINEYDDTPKFIIRARINDYSYGIALKPIIGVGMRGTNEDEVVYPTHIKDIYSKEFI